MLTGYARDIWHADLLAPGPHAELCEPLALFGQFVGSWDMRVRFFDADGVTVFDEPGVWSFGWVLDGRCIQDVLVYPHPHTGDARPSERGIGTSLRHYDPETGTWRVVWLGAVTGTLITLNGGAVGDEIQLEGRDVDGSPLRWMFSDITAGGFRWRGFIADGAGTWWMEQEMLGRRRVEAKAVPS